MTVPEVELPAPTSEIPLKDMPPDQLTVPAHTVTVLPAEALLIADWTALCAGPTHWAYADADAKR